MKLDQIKGNWIMKHNITGKKIKCVLISPPNTTENPNYIDDLPGSFAKNPPLGLAYIAAVLRDNGIEVSIIDAVSVPSKKFPAELNFGLTVDEVKEMVYEKKPDFVGITVYTSLYNNALELAKKIKNVCPNTIIVLGGPHIFSQHRQVIEDEDCVDFCIRGEGEFTFLELINTISDKKDLKNIKGITFKKNGEIIVNPDRTFIKDLDSLPFPARELLPNDVYKGVMVLGGKKDFNTISCSRGCPFSCHFCDVNVVWGRKQRRRTPKNVLDELEYIYKKYKIKSLRFEDDLFCANNKWAIEVCKGIIERRLDIAWETTGRIGVMSEELLYWMKKAGCKVIDYGIEFGNQRILDFAVKGFELNQVYDTVKMTKKAGIAIKGLFMIGYPTETKETIEDTIGLSKHLMLDYALFTIATPFPGTELYEYCVKNNLLKTTDWSKYGFTSCTQVIKLENITEKELFELYHKAAYEAVFNIPYMVMMFRKHPINSLRFGPKLIKKAISSRIRNKISSHIMH